MKAGYAFSIGDLLVTEDEAQNAKAGVGYVSLFHTTGMTIGALFASASDALREELDGMTFDEIRKRYRVKD